MIYAPRLVLLLNRPPLLSLDRHEFFRFAYVRFRDSQDGGGTVNFGDHVRLERLEPGGTRRSPGLGLRYRALVLVQNRKFDARAKARFVLPVIQLVTGTDSHVR